MLIKNKNTQMNMDWFLFCPRIALVIFASLLFGCADDVVRDSAPSTNSVDIDSIPDAVPRIEPRSKYGNPKSYEVFGKRYYVMNNSKEFVQRGIASWYGKKFHGRRTSNGETYDMYAMSAAHKGLPLPSYVEVINLKNNKRVIVRVNDRGPFHENRIIDLSYTAARKLDIVKNGTGLVEIRAINPRRYAKKSQTVKHGAPLRTASTEKSTGGFYVQVGAFANADNARRLQTKLKGLGSNPIQVNEANVKGQTVYRVQIGPLHNVDVADKIVAQLGNYGVTDHSIVVH
jgi:peptidoglycan lytic transglycosylase